MSGDERTRAAYTAVRQLRRDGGCVCKIGPWERIEQFAPTCPFHRRQP